MADTIPFGEVRATRTSRVDYGSVRNTTSSPPPTPAPTPLSTKRSFDGHAISPSRNPVSDGNSDTSTVGQVSGTMASRRQAWPRGWQPRSIGIGTPDRFLYTRPPPVSTDPRCGQGQDPRPSQEGREPLRIPSSNRGAVPAAGWFCPAFGPGIPISGPKNAPRALEVIFCTQP